MNADIAGKPAGDGMPIGNDLTPLLQSSQVTIEEDADGAGSPAFDDDAAATIVWMDWQRAQNWMVQNAWLAEFQYIEYLYQSPNFDREWRSQGSRPARISRFNIAKNRNTMSNQVYRQIFAQQTPFVLEPRGKIAELDNAQDYMDAWTAIFDVLNERADFSYNLDLFIECQALQGTAIAIPIWETRTVKREYRVPKTPPPEVDMPLTGPQTVNTWESDQWQPKEEEFEESWPCFEYRRLGTTVYAETWRTPNRPDLTGGFRIDIDYIVFEDLQRMRDEGGYKDIPDDEELKKFFLYNPHGDAPVADAAGQIINQSASNLMHAAGDETNASEDPFQKPIIKIARWDGSKRMEIIMYEGRKKTIYNDFHKLRDHAFGYSATWWNIENSGYGMGIGRLNAGDQRMDQGVLNEVLKMIAYPMNAPLLYDTETGNAPTQNVVMGLGTLWGVNTRDGDVRKAMAYAPIPEIPREAWQIYELGKSGGEDLVGANSTFQQGNLGGPGSSAARTATGASRIASKSDEAIMGPVQHIEGVITRWLHFLWDMVRTEMPPAEIRRILSAKYGEKILKTIEAGKFMEADFSIKILAGQKLAAKAAISQLIPFFLQLTAQPQLMQFMHEKGETINFGEIAKMFIAMSELGGRQDIVIPLTDDQKKQIAAMNPNAMRMQIEQVIQQMKTQGKLQEIDAQGKQKLQDTIVSHVLEKTGEGGEGGSENKAVGATPLNMAEARTTRNADADILQNGPPALE